MVMSMRMVEATFGMNGIMHTHSLQLAMYGCSTSNIIGVDEGPCIMRWMDKRSVERLTVVTT